MDEKQMERGDRVSSQSRAVADPDSPTPTAEAHEGQLTLLYDLEDKPPARRFVLYSLQHLMTGFATMIGVPLAFSAAVGLEGSTRTALISGVLVAGGVMALIQNLGVGPFGGRLPLVNEATFKFMGPLLLAYKYGGFGAIYMASIISGTIIVALGAFVGFIQRYLTPFIVGSFLIITGVSLMPIAMRNLLAVGKPYEATPEALAAAAIPLLIMVVLMTIRSPRMRGPKSLVVLIGFGVGYIFAAIAGLIDFAPVKAASWFGLAMPFSAGAPSWPGMAITVAFTLVFLACFIETSGDASAVAAILGRKITAKQLRGAVMADGLSGPISSNFGGLPMTTYGQNVGLVRISGVGSRFVVAGTGVMLIVVGLVPKFAGVIAAMPAPVLGAGLAMTFGMIAVEGVRRCGPYVGNARNAAVLILGLVPALTLGGVPDDLLNRIPDTWAPLLTDPLVSGLLVVLIAHLVFPGRTDTTRDHVSD
jgi:uracil-xanthine permease